jgi:N6-adenosine-specific RNA methylase IME4
MFDLTNVEGIRNAVHKLRPGGIEVYVDTVHCWLNNPLTLTDLELLKAHCGKGSRGADRHYKTLSLDEIAATPVQPLTADDCVLFLWVPHVHHVVGNHVPVMRAWGFEPETIGFVWLKQNPSGDGYHIGLGGWTRNQTELCILGTRGNPKRLAKDVPEIITAPIREHSRKPDQQYERIERLVAGPFLELFARPTVEERPGWRRWGNELPPSLLEAAE